MVAVATTAKGWVSAGIGQAVVMGGWVVVIVVNGPVPLLA